MGFTRTPKHAWFVLAALLLFASYGFAATVRIANNTPRFVAKAKNLGAENPSKVISVTAWLHPRNENMLREFVQRVNDPHSADYHRFLSIENLRASYMPTAEDAEAVRKYLESRGLTIERVQPHNMAVMARGTVGEVQSALHVQINRYSIAGKTYRANAADPVIEDAGVAARIQYIDGMHDVTLKPNSVRPINPDTGKAFAGVPLAAVGPKGAFFEAHCFRPVEHHFFTTAGGYPIAGYSGTRYGSDLTAAPPELPPCGYDPYDLYGAYNMYPAFNAGLLGAGQSVVIVDAFGSPTIAFDSASFSAFYGLPPVTLNQYFPDGPPAVVNSGWAGETTLDVEYSSAMAPLATINLVVGFDNSFTHLNNAVMYAITNNLGNVISNSYGAPEFFVDGGTEASTDAVLMLASAAGISVNYSSGDSGDFLDATGVLTVNYPGSSPWATSIGGTSLGIRNDGSYFFQTGWGTHETRIATALPNNFPFDPPQSLGVGGDGFVFGAGGGASGVYPQPSWQAGFAPGPMRQTPDISWLADPFTGVEIIETDLNTNQLTVSVIGGTSLACPMFSGLWALAAEKHGGPLGAAAPQVYTLRPGAVIDVTDLSTSGNVTGSITHSPGNRTNYSAADLVGQLDGTTAFFSALYNRPYTPSYGRWYVLGFGLDSSLTTGPGWDNVTGVGTPNGLAFIKAVAP